VKKASTPWKGQDDRIQIAWEGNSKTGGAGLFTRKGFV